MQLFIDTANIEEIRAAHSWGVISGVTTNPSLLAKEGRTRETVLKEILEIVRGPISAEVVGTDAATMISEGEALAAISEFIAVKVPMSKEGLKAVKHFHENGIHTNVTLIFTVNQALMAALAGATFVSPFINRLEMINHNGVELVRKVAEIFKLQDIPTKIISASIRNPMHVTQAAEVGSHIVTLPFHVLEHMTQHPLTEKGILKFEQDWKRLLETTDTAATSGS